jgi:uncharacterized membrane protein required for colicin V production
MPRAEYRLSAVDRFLIAAAGILAGALIIAFGIFIRRRRHHEG